MSGGTDKEQSHRVHRAGRGYRWSVPSAYHGQEFRSRLEARVACMLDHLGLFWEFEPQGYDLPTGKYLPDFRVTVNQNTQFWIEAKGPLPNAREFSVATDMNAFVAPLLILQGGVPRKENGGTAWICTPKMTEEGPVLEWYMTSWERALAGALLGSDYNTEPPTLQGFEDACLASYHQTYERLNESDGEGTHE